MNLLAKFLLWVFMSRDEHKLFRERVRYITESGDLLDQALAALHDAGAWMDGFLKRSGEDNSLQAITIIAELERVESALKKKRMRPMSGCEETVLSLERTEGSMRRTQGHVLDMIRDMGGPQKARHGFPPLSRN